MSTNKIEKAFIFKNVSFKYHKDKNLILKDLSFSLDNGKSLTIVGINGSGKSTIGKIISGLLLNFEGTVKIFDNTIAETNYQDIISQVGFVFQNPESQFIGENVLQDLAFSLENLQVAPNEMYFRIQNIIEKFNLQDLLNREPVNLSGGDKQKIAIASVLISNPKIIIFDEPTSMLDPKTRINILEIIDDLKKDPHITVIEITHDMERINKSDQVLVLKNGNLQYFGRPNELLLKKHSLLIEKSGLRLPFCHRLSLKLMEAKIIEKIYSNEKELLDVLWKKNK